MCQVLKGTSCVQVNLGAFMWRCCNLEVSTLKKRIFQKLPDPQKVPKMQPKHREEQAEPSFRMRLCEKQPHQDGPVDQLLWQMSVGHVHKPKARKTAGPQLYAIDTHKVPMCMACVVSPTLITKRSTLAKHVSKMLGDLFPQLGWKEMFEIVINTASKKHWKLSRVALVLYRSVRCSIQIYGQPKFMSLGRIVSSLLSLSMFKLYVAYAVFVERMFSISTHCFMASQPTPT